MRRGFMPRRPFRPGRGAPRGRFIAQSSSRNLHATINLTDSDSDYESSGDIQVISVRPSSNNKPLLLSDSEEDGSSNSDSIPYTNIKKTRPREVDWNSKKTPPEIHKKRIEKEDHLRGQSKPFDVNGSSYSSSSYTIEEEPNTNIKQKENDVGSYDFKTPNRNTSIPITKNDQTAKENQNTLKSDNLLEVNHDKNSLYSEPQIKTADENATTNTTDSNLNNNKPVIETPSQQTELITPLPDPLQNIDSNPFQSFIVVRKGKKFSKISFELHENNVAILKSSSKKEGKKTINLIYKEDTVDGNILSIPSYIGYLRSRKKKHSYTYYTTAKKSPKDDREGELLCICYNNNDNQDNSNSANNTNRSPITVVIPKYGAPNYPITQRLTLENFADTNSIDESKYIKLVGTEITSEVESQFGSSFYTKSGKNCALIEPKSNKYVLIFLKSTYEIFNLKVRPPLTFSQGFALAIALIKHDQ